jgi:hypothetical protein
MGEWRNMHSEYFVFFDQYRAIEPYSEGVYEVWRNSSIDGGEWVASCSRRLNPQGAGLDMVTKRKSS